MSKEIELSTPMTSSTLLETDTNQDQDKEDEVSQASQNEIDVEMEGLLPNESSFSVKNDVDGNANDNLPSTTVNAATTTNSSIAYFPFTIIKRITKRRNNHSDIDDGRSCQSCNSLGRDSIITVKNRRKRTRRRILLFWNNVRKILVKLLLVISVLYIAIALMNRLKFKYFKKKVMIQYDYSNIGGVEELKKRADVLSKGSNFGWCYPGMKKRCTCTNPTVGISREGQRHWTKTAHMNAEEVMDEARKGRITDVAFLGDSITEGWKGTSYGFVNGRKKGNNEVFEKMFNLGSGGDFQGMALGISGDTSTNLLWRIQNGEMPSNFNPPVIWVLIGTNDLSMTWCSPESTLIGILSVVEELQSLKPESIIVLNGLLPRSFDQEGGYVMRKKNKGIVHSKSNPPALWTDIQSINHQLMEYSAHRDNVEYVDSTRLFMKNMNVPEDELQIDKNFMNDFLHPSTTGYQFWGNQITKKLKDLNPDSDRRYL